MSYEMSKHVILLYFISLLIGISCISFLVILCKKESSEFYIRIKNFHIALLIYVLYSFSDYYKAFYFLKWEMNVGFMCLANLVTVVFLYNWWFLNIRTIVGGGWNKLYQVIRMEGFLFIVTWTLVYLVFMDKGYDIQPFAGKILATVPDSLFYLSVLSANLYFLHRTARVDRDGNKNILLGINTAAVLINLWAYLNDLTLIFFPFGSEIYSIYPFNPVIAIYVVVNVFTIFYLHRNNAFAWQASSSSTAVNSNNGENLYSFEEIQRRFQLTKREFEIIQLVYQGRSNPEISEYLSISTGTVKRHIQNIFRKMELKNRYELIHLIKSE